MKLIGLTGGIASGKSTVSRMLRDQQLPIIDADLIARQVVEPGRKANRLVRQHFGDDVFLPDGHLDRAKLGDIIFRDPQKRQVLNRCIHPYVKLEILKQAVLHWLKGADMVIFDVPLLLEAGLDKFMGTTVVVFCSDVLQLQRLIKRDGLSEEQANQRITAQMPMHEKVARADIVLDNSSDLPQLEIQVKNMVKKLRPSTVTWFLEYAGPPAAFAISVVAFKTYAPYLIRFVMNYVSPSPH
ncbi:dephospho-CoA kinase [Radiomyces spectabilis]|uniref:dephospho-CoA kinase n=1 Tax=Radiomyces spectabilis TaxID=64574 RepID=UPI002220B867|nr:dephospho-CoA kinase [Radiomyces spectabilis]KAI8381301.1 dephospho-CoA kinase [Radiomyces spectabilis]